MSDEDMEEMRQMRQAKRFQDHESQFGPRKRQKLTEPEGPEGSESGPSPAPGPPPPSADDFGPPLPNSGSTATLTAPEPEIVAGDAAMDAEASLGSFLPVSFGKQRKGNMSFELMEGLAATRKKKAKIAEPKSKESKLNKEAPVYVFGVKNPPQMEEGGVKAEVKAEPQEDVEYEELDAENPFKIPYAHEVALKGHTKAVTALGLDPAGARLLSGAHDFRLCFWDFAAMDRSFKSFRSMEPNPTGNYLIHTVEYSKSGDKFLLGSTSPQAKIYTREGAEICEFNKGYQYLSDMGNTTGHVSNITAAFWHVNNPALVFTAAQDSTIRIWDINTPKKQKTVIKVKNKSGVNKNPISAAVMDPNGKYIFCAATDGSIQAFPANGPFLRPCQCLFAAHQPYSDTSCLRFSKDGYTLISRGGDDTLKLWDLRNFKSAVQTFEDLPNTFPETGCVFSPDENIIATGTSTTKDGKTGTVAFIDKQSLELVKQVGVSSGSIISILWHDKLNQIICGSSDGGVHVLFDPAYSHKGVLYAVSKAPRKARIDEVDHKPEIFIPEDIPVFKDDGAEVALKAKVRRDPSVYHRPEAPQAGFGSKGRIGTSLTADLMKNFVHKDKEDKSKDPRQLILSYADEAKKHPKYFQVYDKNRSDLDYGGLQKYAADMEAKEQRLADRAERERKEREKRGK